MQHFCRAKMWGFLTAKRKEDVETIAASEDAGE
jgi:hypothetical protein